MLSVGGKARYSSENVFEIREVSEEAMLCTPEAMLIAKFVTVFGVGIPRFSETHVPVLHFVKNVESVTKRFSVYTSLI